MLLRTFLLSAAMSAILTAVFFLASCGPKTPPPASNRENEKIVTQLFEHFNRHEWDKLAQLYAEPAEFLDPSLGIAPIPQTRRQIQEKYESLAQIFPDIQDRVLHMYLSGDNQVIVEFVSSGTGPDQQKFELPICTVFTIEKGLITRDHTYYDNTEEPADSK